MQTQPVAKQLEASLWQDLKTAKSKKLLVLGDVIVAIIEIYVMRAKAILSSLEAKDRRGEPIKSSDFLDDLMRQSMSIDLSDMMEKLFPEAEPKQLKPIPAHSSTLAPQDLSASDAMPSAVREATFASVVTDDPKQMLVKLAGNEQVSQWSVVISQWM